MTGRRHASPPLLCQPSATPAWAFINDRYLSYSPFGSTQYLGLSGRGGQQPTNTLFLPNWLLPRSICVVTIVTRRGREGGREG